MNKAVLAAGFLAGWAVFARGGEAPGATWHSGRLRDPSAWPAAGPNRRVAAGAGGLRVEVAPERKFEIAAASGLVVAADSGRVRVRVAETGGGGRWFVRLFGDLRRAGRPMTLAVAQDEPAAGERMFELDPRWCGRPGAAVQLQLGVEGAPGAFAVFAEVEFLAGVPRPNRRPRAVVQAGQLDLPAVENMPNLPEPFQLIDWRQKARDFDQFVFDSAARGEFLPLLWLDDTRINGAGLTFGLPSYVGAPGQGPGQRNSQEGITCMGAVLGATLAGIDKSRQDHDYVAMCEAWFNTRNGLNLVLNRQEAETGGSFWYELFPQLVFHALADRYPEKPRLTEIMRVTSGRWRQACDDLAGPDGVPDFNHLAHDFRKRRAVDNGRWREPDAAAGVAWLEYAAWMRFREPESLAAAENCLRFLARFPENPHYEVLLPFGALTATRIAAEHGRDHGHERLLQWCFDVSETRGGWSVIVGNWGGFDCDGLVGSIDNRGGYAFAMNTFAQAGALAPVPRYDPRYSRAIGKWLLNLANAARLFYPGSLPPGHGTSESWQGDPRQVIAYEGLRREWAGKSPFATGDPLAMNWGPKTDLGLYGSAYVGMLGAIVRSTEEPRILQLDCLATDFFHDKAYPTWLYFNPHAEPRHVRLTVGTDPVSLYDAVSKRFVADRVRGSAAISLPPDGAALVVVTPADGVRRRDGRKLLVDGVVVDFFADAGQDAQ